MNWRVCSIGKPALAYAAAGIADYADRLRRCAKITFHHGKERGPEANATQLLSASEGSLRVALDERGTALSTATLVERINAWEHDGAVKTVSFLVGGADGHTEALRARCDAVWRLSDLTLQHELALLVLLEALYRAYSIKRGEPYHR
jgi:23S rRNA (pseudouridine1915-N3)-methyltransferase